jgi:hypothetical protein
LKVLPPYLLVRQNMDQLKPGEKIETNIRKETV